MLEIRQAISDADKELCYRLRYAVFVDEQKVPAEMEIDEHDETDAIHFLALLNDEPVSASRLVVDETVAKIGRLVVDKARRGAGIGEDMMQSMHNHARQLPGVETIILDAQTYALPFYERLGYALEGDVFMDAGIPHQRMRLKL